MRMQSRAFSWAASVAKYLAMPASRSARSPDAFFWAAWTAAEDARGGGAVAVEDELRRLDALVAELLRAGHRDRQAGELRHLGRLLDDEAGHAGVRRVGGGGGG